MRLNSLKWERNWSSILIAHIRQTSTAKILFNISVGWFIEKNSDALFKYIVSTLSLLGPVMTKFTIALREIGTYKEVLRSQVQSLVFYPNPLDCFILSIVFTTFCSPLSQKNTFTQFTNRLLQLMQIFFPLSLKMLILSVLIYIHPDSFTLYTYISFLFF